jgi:hypothetical protein
VIRLISIARIICGAGLVCSQIGLCQRPFIPPPNTFDPPSESLHQMALHSPGRIAVLPLTPRQRNLTLDELYAMSGKIAVVEVVEIHTGAGTTGDTLRQKLYATTVKAYRGFSSSLWFTVRGGTYTFPDGSRAEASLPNTAPLQIGRRYLVFLNPATPGESFGFNPAEVSDDGAGIFLIDNEYRLHAAQRGTAIAAQLEGMLLTNVINLFPRRPAPGDWNMKIGHDWFTEDKLRAIDLHLSPDMTVYEQDQFQLRVTSFSLVKILWDVLPGAPETIRMSEMKNWPNDGTLSLERFEPYVGNPNAGDPNGNAYSNNGNRMFCRANGDMPNNLWVFGLTANNEVRSICTMRNPRWEGPGGGGDPILNTKIHLDTEVITDRDVTRIAIYETVLPGEGSPWNDRIWTLQKIGEAAIPTEAQVSEVR